MKITPKISAILKDTTSTFTKRISQGVSFGVLAASFYIDFTGTENIHDQIDIIVKGIKMGGFTGYTFVVASPLWENSQNENLDI